MKTWYQVLIYPKVFGFAVINNTITDHPDWRWVMCTLDQYKQELIKQGAIASKIC